MHTDLRFDATGTVWNIRLLGTALSPTTIAAIVLPVIERYSLLFSRFDPRSQLATLNRTKYLAHPDPELVHLVQKAYQVATVTQYAFTPEIGSVLENKGYGHTQKQKTACYPLSITSAVMTLPPDTLLDLGSCAKGYMVDRIANTLSAANLPHFVINAGGDIFATADQDNHPILISVEHPLTQNICHTVPLLHQACCASSNQKRTWTYQGIQQAHIQGMQKNMIGSVVVAKSCCDADILATALLVASEVDSAPLIDLINPVAFWLFQS